MCENGCSNPCQDPHLIRFYLVLSTPRLGAHLLIPHRSVSTSSGIMFSSYAIDHLQEPSKRPMLQYFRGANASQSMPGIVSASTVMDQLYPPNCSMNQINRAIQRMSTEQNLSRPGLPNVLKRASSFLETGTSDPTTIRSDGRCKISLPWGVRGLGYAKRARTVMGEWVWLCFLAQPGVGFARLRAGRSTHVSGTMDIGGHMLAMISVLALNPSKPANTLNTIPAPALDRMDALKDSDFI
ncbi:hypothetical protein BKA70DRAFT_1234955 [Coprinopsis sp. MPI-PUGE-AT-0042]|nr:hypothetical protein BKA70DRAFT_1234955 [Coprinopsis sp. MPI-PUGE-AT-0042]